MERIAYRINKWWLRSKEHVDLSDLFGELSTVLNTVHLTDETIFPSIAVYFAEHTDPGLGAHILIPTAVLHHYLNEKNWAGMHPRLHLEMFIYEADPDDYDRYPEFRRIAWSPESAELPREHCLQVHRTRKVFELFQYWSGDDRYA